MDRILDAQLLRFNTFVFITLNMFNIKNADSQAGTLADLTLAIPQTHS